MTVTVKKIGGSVAVLIPRTLAKEMNLEEGTPVELTGSGDSIVMRRRSRGRRPRRPLAEVLAGLNPAAYRRLRKEFADDGPVGKEIW